MNETFTPARAARVKVAPPLSAHALAELSVWALHEEALLTPKPGLVDGRGSGAHRDMDLPMLLRSATTLTPTFRRFAECAATEPFGPGLRARLAEIGVEGEAAMLATTGQVNTHRGAIWTLGLLIAARVGLTGRNMSIHDLCLEAGEIACLPLTSPRMVSHGDAVFLRYGARGARGEAVDGFPHVRAIALPALRSERERSGNETRARLYALLALVSRLNDTCLLHRGGREALDFAQSGAARVLEAGLGTSAGMAALSELEHGLLVRHASPGGSADLLAATLLVDRLIPSSGEFYGNA